MERKISSRLAGFAEVTLAFTSLVSFLSDLHEKKESMLAKNPGTPPVNLFPDKSLRITEKYYYWIV